MDTAQQLILQKLLSAVDTYRASVIHISVGSPPMMRIATELTPIPDQVVMTPTFIESAIRTWLTEEQFARLQQEKEITIAHTFENKKRFTISAFYQQGHLSLTLQIVPSTIPSLEQLGLPPEAQDLVHTESGLVLVIGPFSSGRSTTLASFVDYLNRHTQKHIVTIEQPVGFLFADQQCIIDQREVGVDVHSVSQGITDTLQEDVDVIVASDISTPEAMQTALEAADAGKVVFGILHAKTVVSAIHFILSRFEGADLLQIRDELSRNLSGIINQRSVATVSGDKRIIAEVLVPNDTIRRIIQRGELLQIENVLMTSREPGIQMLDTALHEAVVQGDITPQEALRHAIHPENFQ